MTKFFFFIAFSLMVSAAGAQDIKDIRNFSLLGQTQKAKEAVDKYLSVPKNAQKGEGWYYKGYIYNLLSKDSSKSITEATALKDSAFTALKKYRELDPKAELLTELNNSTFYELYNGYFYEIGVKAYQAKDPAAAYENFKKGLEVHDYLVANNLSGNNNFKFAQLDTTLTFYTGIAASEAKKPDEAISYYRKLIDANVADSQYLSIYYFLADSYKNKKDNAGFADIIAKGKKNFPSNGDNWTSLEIEQATDGVKPPEIFTRYEELMTKNPGNYVLPYNYGVELFRYIYSDSLKDANTNDFKAKLPEILKKAIAIKPTFEANYVLALFLYNNSIDLSEDARKVKGVKPDDLKKKKDLQAQSDAAMNQSIPYAEAALTAYTSLTKPKASEKINYKQTLTNLKGIYEVKKDAAKVASYDKMIKEVE